MSYVNKAGDITVFVNCASNPEANFERHYNDIAKKIEADEYVPRTTMSNLISMIVLSFDCDDNYGEYDEETGLGGYGNEFTLEECFRYVEESGGYREFDYYC
jgi:hypothetical protein